MSLIPNVLQNGLLSAFDAMKNGDDGFFAKKVSEHIADYVKSGNVLTADVGAVPSGAFTGAGGGSIQVQPSICENIVLAACKAMTQMTEGGNVYLAAQLAAGITSMMSAGSVNTNVTGSVITPSGVPSPLAGTAKGIFTGVSTLLQGGFQAAFTAMDSMKENGNGYLASEIAKAVTAYLKAGVISTQGQAALLGSAGTGTLS